MKTKRLLSLALALILCLSFFAACGEKAPASTPNTSSTPSTPSTPDTSTPSEPAGPLDASNDPVVNLICAHEMNVNSGHGAGYVEFGEYLTEVSGGSITMEHHGSRAICDQSTFIDACLSGVCHYGHNTATYLTSVIPQVACLSIPGYFSGTEEEWLEFAAALHEPMTELLAQYDLKYMGADYPGVAALYGTGDPITSPADCKGKVIRSAGEYLSKSIEAWGAAATTIPMPDIASSIERGTVDACYTMYAMLNDQGFKDLVDWAVYTTNQETFSAMIMSMSTYEDMTDAQKAIIDEAAKIYPEMSMDDYDYAALVQGVRDTGVNVVELTDEESAAFTEATRALFEEFGRNTDEYGLALLKVIYDFNGWEWIF